MPPLSVIFLPVPPSINLGDTHNIDSDEGTHFTAQKQLACWKVKGLLHYSTIWILFYMQYIKDQ